VTNAKKRNPVLIPAAVLAALALGAYLFVNYGNPQRHWRLYAYQARNLDPQRLEPGAGYSGAWNNWEQNGHLISTYTYRNGQRDGGYTTYADDGSPVTVGQYRNGGFDGIQKIAREGGFRTEITYRDGKLEGTETTWYPNGQIAVQATYANDVQEGPMTSYSENGMIQSVAPYYNNVIEGVAQTFHPDGKVNSEETYSGGALNGTSSFYRPDGSLDMVLSYRDNVMDGVQTWYYPDGKTKMKEFRAALGEPNGEWKEWNEKGEVTVDEVYENGVLKERDGEEVQPLGESGETGEAK
jgi:antitoxin component YwqK of YwqJK toxin-antitoxin module